MSEKETITTALKEVIVLYRHEVNTLRKENLFLSTFSGIIVLAFALSSLYFLTQWIPR